MRGFVFLTSLWILVGIAPSAFGEGRIGERPTIESHLDQAKIESGKIGLTKLFRHGERLFAAVFNQLDGQGRPGSTGTGMPRSDTQPPFVRLSGPDANSCAGCHIQPRVGGAGDFVANVFVLAQALDPVAVTLDIRDQNERNTLGMMGSGAIEMLAREMTTELIAIRKATQAKAVLQNAPATQSLLAKGVSFGTITVYPDGQIDPRGIDGVDWDLIIKPFNQKGTVVSLRDFSNTAMNHHHGMQAVERFGLDIDADNDGKVNELTIGDITAITIFQAGLNIPGIVLPKHPAQKAAAKRGKKLFSDIGCAVCHIPALVLNSPIFTEPNPFNPPGNLRSSDVKRPFSFDMTQKGGKPRLTRLPNGSAMVFAFTDLKRHDINDSELNHFANERAPQGLLIGVALPSQFTEHPLPRPTREFITRKLWDVGNSAPYGHRGDLTTLTEAIYFHGGEARASRNQFFAAPESNQAAIIEFLKTLQVVPEGRATTRVAPTAGH